MASSTLSGRGQVVIPVAVRRKAGFEPGDKLSFEVDEASRRVTVSKKETLEELAERLSQHLRPGTEPLTDASAFYATRKPRR